MKLVAWVVGYVMFLALAVTACGSGGGAQFDDVVTLDGLTVPITDAPEGPYTLLGSVVNLQGAGLRLNDGFEDIDVQSGETTFIFKTKLPSGSNYDVRVVQQPSGQTCAVSYGQGRIRSTERKVIVNCALPSRFAFMLDTNDIVRYDYEQETGNMTGPTRTRWTSGAFSTSYYSLTKHPLQPYIFVFHAYEHTLEAFHVDSAGVLVLTDTATVPFEDGNAFRVRITPDGKYVYIGGKQNNIYGFEFHEGSGTMTGIANGSPVVDPSGAVDLVSIDDFEMDPQGKYVYGSNLSTGVSTLSIGPDGILHYVGRYKGAVGVGMMSIAPVGNVLFASSATQSEVQVINVADGVLSAQATVQMSVHDDFWTGIQVDPTGKTVFVNERDSAVMGAYPVSSLMAGTFAGAVETPVSSIDRSFLSFSVDGKFVYSQRHNPRGLDGYHADITSSPAALGTLTLPPETSQSLAFLIY